MSTAIAIPGIFSNFRATWQQLCSEVRQAYADYRKDRQKTAAYIQLEQDITEGRVQPTPEQVKEFARLSTLSPAPLFAAAKGVLLAAIAKNPDLAGAVLDTLSVRHVSNAPENVSVSLANEVFTTILTRHPQTASTALASKIIAGMLGSYDGVYSGHEGGLKVLEGRLRAVLDRLPAEETAALRETVATHPESFDFMRPLNKEGGYLIDITQRQQMILNQFASEGAGPATPVARGGTPPRLGLGT